MARRLSTATQQFHLFVAAPVAFAAADGVIAADFFVLQTANSYADTISSGVGAALRTSMPTALQWATSATRTRASGKLAAGSFTARSRRCRVFGLGFQLECDRDQLMETVF